MKKTYSFFLALVIALGNTFYAQIQPTKHNDGHLHNHAEPCKFDQIHQDKMLSDAEYRRITEEINHKIATGQLVPVKSGTVHQIPVVVHVLHTGEPVGTGWNISDEQVKKGIEYLNNFWRKVAGTPGGIGPGADMELEFALAVRDPSNNCTNGIVRRNMSSFSAYVNNGVGSGGISESEAKAGRWSTNDYYNIYLVNKIDGANCFSGGGYTAGYAYFPSAHGNNLDGTVCLICSYVDERDITMAHELGHAFGLFHTFEACSESNCSTGGDRVCDTRPHQQADCSTTSCTGDGTFDNSRFNYMSYCNTTERFTEGQKTRARSFLSDTARRGRFLQSNGNNKLIPPSGATLDFYASGTGGCIGTPIKFTDNSFCIPNTYITNTGWPNHTFAWTVSGPENFSSSLQNPTFTFNTAGTYSVTLTITNAQGTFTHSKPNYIVISAAPSGGTNACTPTSNNNGNFAQTVFNVSFKDINNATSSLTNVAYTNFICSKTTTVTEGETHQLSVSLRAGGSGREWVEVWIDWNNNGVIDAGETVLTGSTPTTNTTTVVSANITIPTSAVKNRLLRMRVMGEVGSSNPFTANKKNCSSNYVIGDVEDYGVVVLSTCGTITSTTPGERCGPGSVALGASGQGTFNWYSNLTGGASLGTGSPFNTPSISTTTTYYVDATFNGCTSSPRTAVVASINSAVAQATLVSPANGATSVSSTPTYQWNALSGASSYDLQVATDVGFTSIVTNTNVTTNSFVQAPALNNNTTYYWRVRGVNSCGAGTYSSTFSFTTQNIVCSTVASTNVPITIPTTVSTVSSTLNFPTNVNITDVNVLNLQGTHTWIADLRFRLQGPDGTEIVLLDQICGDQDNFNINFDDSGSPYANIPCPPTNGGTFQPLNTLSAFNGKSSQGTWTLFIDDVFAQDGGSLTSWSLQICGEGCVAPSQPTTIAGSSTPCQGSSQTYSITNVAGVTYNWTFPSGWTQTAGGTTNSVTVTVGSSSGNITVTPSNSCGTGTAQTLAVTVGTLPAQPSTITGNTTVCQGTSQTYSVTNVSGVTYNWTFPSGWVQTAGGTTNSVTVTVGASSGNVTVTPSNACGNGTARSLAVTVNTVPAQPSTITGNTTVCQGTSQTYSVTNVSGVTYNWTFPSGWVQTAGGTTNSVTVTVGASSGNVTVTPSNACGNGTARSLAVTVNTVPAQPSTITGNPTVCEGTSQTYSVTNVSGVTYNWTFPSGWIQTAGGTTNSVTVTVGASSGNVTVIPSNACGNGTARTLAVTVNLLSANAGSISGSASLCNNATGATYSVTPVANATNYNWVVPAGASITSGQGTNTITVNFGTTSGNITVTPSNICGSGGQSSLFVTISNSVVPSLSIASDLVNNISCTGSNVSFTATPLNEGTSPTYQWRVNGANVGSNASVITLPSVNNGDLISCLLTNNDGCANPATVTSNEITMTVVTIDNGVGIEGNTLTASQNDASYQWIDCNDGNAPIVNATGQTFQASNSGNYAVVVSISGCEAVSNCLTYVNDLSISEQSISEIKIYPNPNKGNFTVDLGNEHMSGSLEISDVLGKIVYSRSIQNTNKLIVDMIGSSGVYIATITNRNGGVEHVKFVIE
jgi:subtilisin-like proprotein convertase family protein